MRRWEREDETVALFERIADYAAVLDRQTLAIDYFATSLPAMLLFEADLKQAQTVQVRYLAAQECFGLGRIERGHG